MKKIENKINEIPEGQFFKYDEIRMEGISSYGLSKALSRLSKKGTIQRYKKGVYFKPKNTVFGKIGPSEEEQIELLIGDDNIKGYLSGSTIYNQWGVTTQISNEIVIVTDKPKKNSEIGKIKVKYSKGILPEKKADIRKHQLLDILKDFNRIPDRNDEIFVEIIKNEIKTYDNQSIVKLVELAKKYNPRTRALLGALLELFDFNNFAKVLKKTLNDLSKFEINISDNVLPNKENWKIV